MSPEQDVPQEPAVEVNPRVSMASVQRLGRLIHDFNNGLPQLRRTHPELATKIDESQRAVAESVYRDGDSIPSLRNMRF